MKQVLAVFRYNLHGFFKNPRVVLTFLLEIVLSFLLSSRVTEVTDRFDTPVQAAEPFLWTFGDSTAVLLSSMLLLLIFSDLPKMTPITAYQLLRTTKKKWILAQLFYVTAVTALYTGFMLLITVILCMKNSYVGNIWSETAAMLGYSSLGETLQVPSTVRVMESISPYGCMMQALLLLFCYSLTLSFVILAGNLYGKKNSGMLFGLLYSLYGFLLDPKVLGALLHKEEYEMYQVNVLVSWISPLSHAVYGRHNFGYDRLPRVWQSCALFLLLLGFLSLLSVRRMNKYPFEFLGETS